MHKEDKRNTNIDHGQNHGLKRILSSKQNDSYDIISIDPLLFKIQGSGRGLSMLSNRYKLTNITKTKKFGKNGLKRIEKLR